MGCISIAITEYVCPVRTLTFYPIPFIFSVSLNDSRMFEPKHYFSIKKSLVKVMFHDL